jgi:hypothetical protein
MKEDSLQEEGRPALIRDALPSFLDMDYIIPVITLDGVDQSASSRPTTLCPLKNLNYMQKATIIQTCLHIRVICKFSRQFIHDLTSFIPFLFTIGAHISNKNL